jgi:F0F1-type ATP synthase assembly protein I
MAKDDKLKGYRQVARATTIPLMLLAGPAVGYFIGYLLDGLFDTTKVFTLIFLLLGLGAGGMESYKIIKEIQKDDES